MMKATRPSVWIPSIMVAWAICCICMGLVTNYAGLLATRAALGIAEGGLFPGVSGFFVHHVLEVLAGFCSSNAQIAPWQPRTASDLTANHMDRSRTTFRYGTADMNAVSEWRFSSLQLQPPAHSAVYLPEVLWNWREKGESTDGRGFLSLKVSLPSSSVSNCAFLIGIITNG